MSRTPDCWRWISEAVVSFIFHIGERTFCSVCFLFCLHTFLLKSVPAKTQVCGRCVARGNTCAEVAQRSGFNRSAKTPSMPPLISARIMLSHWLVTLKKISFLGFFFKRNKSNKYLTLTKGSMQFCLVKKKS